MLGSITRSTNSHSSNRSRSSTGCYLPCMHATRIIFKVPYQYISSQSHRNSKYPAAFGPWTTSRAEATNILRLHIQGHGFPSPSMVGYGKGPGAQLFPSPGLVAATAIFAHWSHVSHGRRAAFLQNHHRKEAGQTFSFPQTGGLVARMEIPERGADGTKNRTTIRDG